MVVPVTLVPGSQRWFGSSFRVRQSFADVPLPQRVVQRCSCQSYKRAFASSKSRKFFSTL
jgi:hypothetical protein